MMGVFGEVPCRWGLCPGERNGDRVMNGCAVVLAKNFVDELSMMDGSQ